MEASTPLAVLLRPGEYRAQRGHIFPSEGSLEWYTRTHSAALQRAGAIVKVGGRWFIHEQHFDDFVLTGGKVAA